MSHTSSAVQWNVGRRVCRSMAHVFRLQEIGALLTLIGLALFFTAATPQFFTLTNLQDVLRQIPLVAIIAVGMTFLIITGEFDFSVGSLFGLSAAVAGLLARDYDLNLWTTIPICLALGAVVGLTNGLLCVKLGVPSLILTLGMLSGLRAVSLVLAKGWPVLDLPRSSFSSVFAGNVFGAVPAQTLWMLGIVLTAAFVLRNTMYGFHVYATGSNKKAAQLAGINTDWVKVRNFILVAVLAAGSGLISLAYLSYQSRLGVIGLELDVVSKLYRPITAAYLPVAGTGMEVDVIAAVVIGGTSVFGGSGTILGTLLGAVAIGIARNGMVLLRVPAYWQDAIVGMVLIGAIIVDTIIAKRRRRR